MDKVRILFLRHLHVKRKSNSLCPPEENIKKNKEDIKTKKQKKTKKTKKNKKKKGNADVISFHRLPMLFLLELVSAKFY